MSPVFRVSVVIPCFNAADTLERAVRSVVAQDDYGTEILIVDDQSTDNSEDVAHALAKDTPGMWVLRQPQNAGPGAARNAGLRQARGRYVCFLDADDEYAPGFFKAALSILETRSELSWISTGVELVNCHREVHPVQLQAVVGSIPSNLLIRKAAADLIGGFSEDQAFRGKSAGEDIAFRVALRRSFQGMHIPDRFLRYWVKPGSHFDYFLDRTTVEKGELVFLPRDADEADADLAIADRMYQEHVKERLAIRDSLADPGNGDPRQALAAFEAVGAFEDLSGSFAKIQGFLLPQEGFALYYLAKEGPGRGAIVEIGSLFGRSTCWLAAGTRAARREKVVAVDHFRGSPEHREGGSHPISALAQSGTAFPSFVANLQNQGLRDWVDIRVGNSVEIGAAWKSPVRLLFIDGDHTYEAVRADFDIWGRHVIPGGLVAFHDVETFPDVTRLYQEVLATKSWKEIARVETLRIVLAK